VRTRREAIAISPANKTVERNVATGEVTTESYDKLVPSPGALPITPPLPGVDLPGIFRVRTVPDVKVVVGGGFIGLEMAENLVHRERPLRRHAEPFTSRGRLRSSSVSPGATHCGC
jgi:NADPH-dependent 2,4-dienoyl-CoA reductase/sulfur reductase-like enzyme